MKNSARSSFDVIMEQLKKAKKVGIFVHEKPDGDALGSAFATKAILESIGKVAEVYFACEPPEKFSYLYTGYEILPKSISVDTALSLDCGALSRLGKLSELYQKAPLKLAIDHHFSNSPFGDFFFSDHTCAACCELVYKMAINLCGDVPKSAMAGIYTGLSTDTGHFKYSNVTEETMKIAGCLIGKGLRHRDITSVVYDNAKVSKLKFMGEVANKTEFFADGKIAFFYCSDKLLEEFELLPEDLEELPNTVLSMEGALIGVLLKDAENGTFKVSLRGRDIVDLSSIAASFNGGGHKNAAAFKIEENKDETLRLLLDKITAELDRL